MKEAMTTEVETETVADRENFDGYDLCNEVVRLRSELATMTENRDRGMVAHNDTMRAWAEQVIDLEQKLDEARKLALEWRTDAAGYRASPEDTLQLYPFPWEETK